MQKKDSQKKMPIRLSRRTRELDDLLAEELDMALKRRAKRVVEELDLEKGDKILEAGCGPGYYLNLLARLGAKYQLYGVDIDEKALAIAKKIPNTKSVLKADLTRKLPFSTNFFDKVILSEVVEHIPNEKKALKEIYRVLRPGGKVVVTVPNKNYPLMWDPVNGILEKFTGKHIRQGPWAGIWSNHLRLYSEMQIKNLVKKSKFTVEKTESLTWWCLPFNHYLLYGDKLKLLPKKLYDNIQKSLYKKSLAKSLILKIVNLNDSINSFFKPKNLGIVILVVAKK